MHLLLDALKKTGQAAQTNAVQGTPSDQSTPELTLENLPEMPQQKTARQVDDDLARLSAHNLFAAKPARTVTRLGIVPLTVLGGLLLAVGGSYYVWREISPAPMIKHQNSAPIAISAPPSTVPTPLVLAPNALPVLPEMEPVAEVKPSAARRTPAPAAPPPQTFAPNAVQPIRIEHGNEMGTVDTTLLAGYQAYRNDDLDAARQHYGDVLHKDAKNRDALLGLAAIALQQSQDDIAAGYYRQVLALDPRDPIAHAGMSTLFGTADTAGTESRLKLLLLQQPQSAALHFALGNHYAEQSRWGEAQQAYFEAVRRDRDDGVFAFNLAVSLDHLGQTKLAAQYYQRALQLSPSDTAGFNRAQVQQRANELTAP